MSKEGYSAYPEYVYRYSSSTPSAAVPRVQADILLTYMLPAPYLNLKLCTTLASFKNVRSAISSTLSNLGGFILDKVYEGRLRTCNPHHDVNLPNSSTLPLYTGKQNVFSPPSRSSTSHPPPYHLPSTPPQSKPPFHVHRVLSSPPHNPLLCPLKLCSDPGSSPARLSLL